VFIIYLVFTTLNCLLLFPQIYICEEIGIEPFTDDNLVSWKRHLKWTNRLLSFTLLSFIPIHCICEILPFIASFNFVVPDTLLCSPQEFIVLINIPNILCHHLSYRYYGNSVIKSNGTDNELWYEHTTNCVVVCSSIELFSGSISFKMTQCQIILILQPITKLYIFAIEIKLR